MLKMYSFHWPFEYYEPGGVLIDFEYVRSFDMCMAPRQQASFCAADMWKQHSFECLGTPAVRLRQAHFFRHLHAYGAITKTQYTNFTKTWLLMLLP